MVVEVKWELLKQVFSAFGEVQELLENDNLPSSRRPRLRIFWDPPKWHKLRMELVVLIEAGEPFIKWE